MTLATKTCQDSRVAGSDASTGIAAIVGANIRRARESAGLNQRELAAKLGGKLTNQSVSDWERAVVRPSDENLTRVATVLGHEFAWFFMSHNGDEPGA